MSDTKGPEGELAARLRFEEDSGTTSHLSDYAAWSRSPEPGALAGLSYKLAPATPLANPAETTSPPSKS
jgi:hypothetical protein